MSGTPNVVVLDIETSPMLVYTFGLWNQNIGINQIVEPTRMLSWAAKWYGKPKVLFASEYHDGPEQMVKGLVDLVNEADVIVHFNGISFDMKHIRREAMVHGLVPPAPSPEIDLLQVAKKALYLPSYKLDYIAQYLGLGAKEETGGFSLWRRCLEGDPAAWALMRKYNKHDVVITEKVLDKLRPYLKGAHLGLLAGEYQACAKCGGTNLQHRGFAYTLTGKYQRFQCQTCFGWSRGKKAVATIDARGVA